MQAAMSASLAYLELLNWWNVHSRIIAPLDTEDNEVSVYIKLKTNVISVILHFKSTDTRGSNSIKAWTCNTEISQLKDSETLETMNRE